MAEVAQVARTASLDRGAADARPSLRPHRSTTGSAMSGIRGVPHADSFDFHGSGADDRGQPGRNSRRRYRRCRAYWTK